METKSEWKVPFVADLHHAALRRFGEKPARVETDLVSNDPDDFRAVEDDGTDVFAVLFIVIVEDYRVVAGDAGSLCHDDNLLKIILTCVNVSLERK